MSYKVKTIDVFEKQAKKLIKKHSSLKTELFQLIQKLKENPEQGTAIGNNCFKLRIAIASKGKGKSGGARIITNIIITDATVYLLSIYDKSEKENLSDKNTKFAPRILKKRKGMSKNPLKLTVRILAAQRLSVSLEQMR
jgi:mRNA-degrading endonuclease RelE of RelBE toxin-antitoxin system